MIHDHQDGENHCMDCRGPCKLEGAELILSRIVRRVASAGARYGKSPLDIRGILKKSGVPAADIARIEAAAVEADHERGPRISWSE